MRGLQVLQRVDWNKQITCISEFHCRVLRSKAMFSCKPNEGDPPNEKTKTSVI
ncbi:hypothetical protein MPTK2_3g07400 [Marchantia polymorpha subsp. ruderalis]